MDEEGCGVEEEVEGELGSGIAIRTVIPAICGI